MLAYAVYWGDLVLSLVEGVLVHVQVVFWLSSFVLFRTTGREGGGGATIGQSSHVSCEGKGFKEQRRDGDALFRGMIY